MINVRDVLPRYFDILEENGIAKFIQCKYVPVRFSKTEAIKSLWEKHGAAIENTKLCDIIPEKSLLDLKIELASRIFNDCCLCERRCRVDRKSEVGYCGVQQPLIVSEFLHLGEESILVPSYTVFFSGCTFHCVFCQNWDISQRNLGLFIEPKRMGEMINKRKKQGAKNVNWVGGDPTPNLHYILKTLKYCRVNIPQIWNSNMYCSKETIKILNGIIDVYLTDFKYGKNGCALRLSKVDNYVEIVKRNHMIAYENGEVIIRHLVMPNHIECCSKPIIKWVANNLSEVAFNTMSQYHPKYKAYNYKEISHPISQKEFNQVKKCVNELGINEI